MDNKDIELVMAQASVPYEKAVEALFDQDNDIGNAIMQLSTSN